MPTLTLHTAADPLVAVQNQALLREASGSTEDLVQIASASTSLFGWTGAIALAGLIWLALCGLAGDWSGLHTECMVRDLVLMKLNAVGLRGARDLLPSQVSGGMARRVALARAIALDPDLIMYDEPFAGLDPISMSVAATLIRDLNSALGVTSIVVSHDVDETFLIADHVVFIANGRVVAQGTPDDMRHSEDPLVQQFVGGLPDGPVRFHYPAVPLAEDFGVGGPAQ